MKKAIVTGATGLVGKAVVSELSKNNISVLCIGRKKLSKASANEFFGENISYISVQMNEILSLPSLAKSIGWVTEDECVFYHFAWSGQESLTDGSFDDQLSNAVNSANAVKCAKLMGCSKFVNCGSLQETLIENHINKHNNAFKLEQINYSSAKLASWKICNITSYLEKIDYVHTRLSVPLDPQLTRGGYVAKTLQKIACRQPIDTPKNNSFFDIIILTDVAHAFFLVGKFGKNQANYFIGTSKPTTLPDYFDGYKMLINNPVANIKEVQVPNDIAKIFDAEQLLQDTGFKTAYSRFDLTPKGD